MDELAALRAENARLVALLDAHGIDWRVPALANMAPEQSRISTEEKIALFRRLFRGRTDVYPVRWESKACKSGYAPACANEWRSGICEKPRIKCSDCGQRLLIPLSDSIIYDHLAGQHTIGVYGIPHRRCRLYPGRRRRISTRGMCCISEDRLENEIPILDSTYGIGRIGE